MRISYAVFCDFIVRTTSFPKRRSSDLIGFSSALTPRSTSRTMALFLISRSVGGVISLGVKGDGDVRDFSPGSTSFYPVHREGGELIDFGFSGCQHQTAKIREVRHRIGRCPQPLP